jgi:hypothetical protein
MREFSSRSFQPIDPASIPPSLPPRSNVLILFCCMTKTKVSERLPDVMDVTARAAMQP